MNYKLLYLFAILSLPTPILPFLNNSPWIVIDNDAQLDFNCQIKALYIKPEDQEEIILYFNVDDNFHITFEDAVTQDDTPCFNITIECACNAQKTMIIYPMFFDADKNSCNPELLSVSFYHQALQIALQDSKKPENNHFALRYQEDRGITLQTEPLSVYIKCLNSFKQTIRAIILCALNATDWLPY